MRGLWQSYRFLIGRRVTQISILLLLVGGYLWKWKILVGNLSSAKLFGAIPLSDPFAVLQIMVTGIMPGSDVLIGAGIILALYGLIAGRSFCSWVCPVNMVTDTAGWVREKLQSDKTGVRLWMNRRIRYFMLGLTLILSVIFAYEAFEVISPISMLHRGLVYGMGFGWLLILAVFLFDLFVYKHGFCGHICPLGAFYSLMTRYTLIRVRHVVEDCTQCNDCFKVCPESQVLSMIGKESIPVLSGECTNCGRCVEVCPTPSLRVGLRFK